MKVCPICSFANNESFPTCAFCNALLVDVPSTPSADPGDREHERQTLTRQRHASTRRQIRSAGIVYALVITALAVVPGLIFNPLVLLLYCGSAMVVAVALAKGLVGQFSASFLQGFLSVVLMLGFGPMQPLIFFMLLGHVVAPSFFWHWVDLIQSANR